MEKRKSEAVLRALEILQAGRCGPSEAKELVPALKKEKEFSYARRILSLARREPAEDPGLARWLRQQQALCTYKDTYLSTEKGLDLALSILSEEDLDESQDPETLGLAGAIYKRKWDLEGRAEHLERSLGYYRRGYALRVREDMGYTGVNAAFVSDLLAWREERQGAGDATGAASAAERRQEARRIREDLVATLPGWIEAVPDQAKWGMLSLAEAHFGLGRYDESLEWLRKPQLDEWEQETAARQLATLARVGEGAPEGLAELQQTPAWQTLVAFLGDRAAGVWSAFLGKIGVALSGGGFRASLFHIGVLAKLAELDLLRHVEVFSCVSGGSIVGAHYYLEARHLLQRSDKPDGAITRQDYVDIVGRLAQRFLAGVQRNVRTRAVADLGKNFEMLMRRSYSRTHRIGELFEEEIYSRVEDGGATKPRWINDLLVTPAGEPEGFEPKKHNWKRAAKAPVLILNATTLNTGHNWQFTATWMGESEASVHPEVDGNYRLRRMYYWEAPERYQQVRLGHAVAASACVPGLFEPIALEDLYPGKTVRLVDGGVHDNQGVVGLMEQDCSVLLVSDASGQTEAQDHPSNGILGVPLRSNNILMARVREAQYSELSDQRRSGRLRGLLYVHLKKGLPVEPVTWGRPGALDEGTRPKGTQREMTTYGILNRIQARLAAIRTDLDSFCDAEAHALMTSGYRMVEEAVPGVFPGLPEPDGPKPQWAFLAVEEAMQRPERSLGLERLLDVAAETVFKVWRLSRGLQILAVALGVVFGVLFLWACFRWASFPIVTLGMIGSAAVAVAGAAVIGKTAMKIVRIRDTLNRIGIAICMATAGYVAAWVHLGWFDRRYLRLGRVGRILSWRPGRR